MSVLIIFIKLIAVFDLLVIAVYFGGDILSTMLNKLQRKPKQDDPFDFSLDTMTVSLSIDSIRQLYSGDAADFVEEKILPNAEKTMAVLTEQERTAARLLLSALIGFLAAEAPGAAGGLSLRGRRIRAPRALCRHIQIPPQKDAELCFGWRNVVFHQAHPLYHRPRAVDLCRQHFDAAVFSHRALDRPYRCRVDLHHGLGLGHRRLAAFGHRRHRRIHRQDLSGNQTAPPLHREAIFALK